MSMQSTLTTHPDQLVLLLAGLALIAACATAITGLVLGRRQFEIQDARKRLDRAVGALMALQQALAAAPAPAAGAA